MDLTKSFTESVATLCKKGAESANALHNVAYKGVCKAYAGDMQYMQYLFDNVPKYMQAPLHTWAKSVGIDVFKPCAGSPRYYVNDVVDKSKQADKLKTAKSKPVMHVAHSVPKAKEPKPLQGTPKERALAALAAVVKRKSKDDEACAEFLNEAIQMIANIELEVRDGE